MKKTSIDLPHELAYEAKKWVWVREEPGNKGAAVQRFQQAIDGKALDEPWCAGFCGFCIKEVEARTGVKSDLILSEHVLTMWNQNGTYRCDYPEVGMIAIWRKKGTTQGHCGIVIEADEKCESFMTIEGNTSGDEGLDRDGQGVWQRRRPMHDLGGFKLLGFLRPFR